MKTRRRFALVALSVAVFVAIGAALALGHTNTQSFAGGSDCWKYGHEHRDVFYMGNGNDCALMNQDNDDFHGGGDVDYGGGEGGNDLVEGNDGDDYVEGMFGTDHTKGGAGPDDSDVLHGDANDTVNGGDGNNDVCHIDTAFGYAVDFIGGGCNYYVVP